MMHVVQTKFWPVLATVVAAPGFAAQMHGQICNSCELSERKTNLQCNLFW
jgi:hypothetical protein